MAAARKATAATGSLGATDCVVCAAARAQVGLVTNAKELPGR